MHGSHFDAEVLACDRALLFHEVSQACRLGGWNKDMSRPLMQVLTVELMPFDCPIHDSLHIYQKDVLDIYIYISTMLLTYCDFDVSSRRQQISEMIAQAQLGRGMPCMKHKPCHCDACQSHLGLAGSARRRRCRSQILWPCSPQQGATNAVLM